MRGLRMHKHGSTQAPLTQQLGAHTLHATGAAAAASQPHEGGRQCRLFYREQPVAQAPTQGLYKHFAPLYACTAPVLPRAYEEPAGENNDMGEWKVSDLRKTLQVLKRLRRETSTLRGNARCLLACHAPSTWPALGPDTTYAPRALLMLTLGCPPPLAQVSTITDSVSLVVWQGSSVL